MSFLKKYKNRLIVTIVTIILIIVIGVTNKNNSMAFGENFLGNIFSPISKAFYTVGSKISNSFDNMEGVFSSSDKKKGLEEKLLKLEDENRRLQNIVGKSDFLKIESELLKKTDLNLISAKVISKEPGNWYNKFTIDKGTEDGLKEGDIIIQGINLEGEIIKEGLIGKIIKAGDKSSKVITLIDEQNSVSFKVIRTQDGGIVKGSIDNIDSYMEGYLFDRNADVVVGDELYTSGLGKGYIEDLYIGEVEDVIQLEEELMKKIIVKPAINYKKIYKVFAIVE